MPHRWENSIIIQGESLEKIARLFPYINEAENHAGMQHSTVHKYKEYNYTKPNTKPYSAFKRLYRVQER